MEPEAVRAHCCVFAVPILAILLCVPLFSSVIPCVYKTLPGTPSPEPTQKPVTKKGGEALGLPSKVEISLEFRKGI